MGININQGGKPVALVLLRSYEQSQLPSPNKRRRMPAQKRLVDMYPDWPDTDPADVRNEVHRRLVLLAKNVQMQAGKHGSIRYVARLYSLCSGALASLVHNDYSLRSRRVDPQSRYDHGD